MVKYNIVCGFLRKWVYTIKTSLDAKSVQKEFEVAREVVKTQKVDILGKALTVSGAPVTALFGWYTTLWKSFL